MICRWCGGAHGAAALCQRAQRGMTRRSFLFLSSAAAVGALLPTVPVEPVIEYEWKEASGIFIVQPNIGQLVAEAWNKVIGQAPEDNIFSNRAFFNMMRDELNANVIEQPVTFNGKPVKWDT